MIYFVLHGNLGIERFRKYSGTFALTAHRIPVVVVHVQSKFPEPTAVEEVLDTKVAKGHTMLLVTSALVVELTKCLRMQPLNVARHADGIGRYLLRVFVRVGELAGGYHLGEQKRHTVVTRCKV